MRRLLALTGFVVSGALLFAIGLDPAEGHPNPGGGRITAEDVAHIHNHHGHTQWRRGQGTPHHTWRYYRREARRRNAYVAAARRNRARQAAVRRWQGVANCESGGNWRANTGNGYYGGLQFSLSTWRAYGGGGYPHANPAWRQAQIADRVRTQSGLHHWPNCGRYY
jgi:hypothetical protein